MNQLLTTGIILRRTDYGEADRIILLLTPGHGKISLVAKGVRKVKSKLAGGIELFSVSQLSYLPPRTGSGLGTLVSSRLDTHYGHIVQDINRTMLGYDLIKQLDKVTEDNPEPEYFQLLQASFQALDDPSIDLELIQTWFVSQLIRQSGHSPNLHTDTAGNKLDAAQAYSFDFDAMTFEARPDGPFGADDIKFLRLLFSGNSPQLLQKVTGWAELLKRCQLLIRTQADLYISR